MHFWLMEPFFVLGLVFRDLRPPVICAPFMAQLSIERSHICSPSTQRMTKGPLTDLAKLLIGRRDGPELRLFWGGSRRTMPPAPRSCRDRSPRSAAAAASTRI